MIPGYTEVTTQHILVYTRYDSRVLAYMAKCVSSNELSSLNHQRIVVQVGELIKLQLELNLFGRHTPLTP